MKDPVLRIVKLFFIYLFSQVLFTIIAMVGVIVYGVVSGGIPLEQITANPNAAMSLIGGYNIWGVALGLFFSSIFMLWYILRFGYFRFGKSPFSQVKGNVMLLSILLVFAAMFIFNILAQWAELPDNLANVMTQLSNNVIGVVSIAVVGPILEEVLFRGAIQGVLMRVCKPWTAILIASLIFGVVHMNPIQIFYATFIGILFGWIYYRTGSLMPSIIGHVLNNSLAAVTMILGTDEAELLSGATAENICLAVSVVASVALVLMINRLQPAVPVPWHDAGEEV